MGERGTELHKKKRSSIFREKLTKKMKSEFQSKRTFEERCRDSASISEQHPDKVAVIVERSKSEKQLPVLDKSKFLVPGHVTVTELIRVLRRRLQKSSELFFYWF